MISDGQRAAGEVLVAKQASPPAALSDVAMDALRQIYDRYIREQVHYRW